MEVNLRNAFEVPRDVPELRIVIDVFRASSTTVALSESGLRSLYVANDFETLTRLHSEGFVVVSEVFDLGIDNSPTLVREHDFKNKSVVLKTANLTTAIEKNFFEGPLWIACFNNLSAVAEKVRSAGFRKIEILPAGFMEIHKQALEDSQCADLLQEKILRNPKALPDRKLLRDHIRNVEERNSPSTHYIQDVHLAIEPDISKVVPTVHRKDKSLFEIRF